MRMRYVGLRVILLSAWIAAVSSQASAHHPMGGETPQTLWHGLLSGLGHPIIGLDHAAFVVGLGIFAAIAGFGIALPALFVVFMAVGLAIHIASLDVPAVELIIALSVVCVGIAILWPGIRSAGWVVGGLFALAGIAHGFAYAEAVIGAETAVIGAYIAGLIAIQMAIATGAYLITSAIMRGRTTLSFSAVRLAGLAILLTGAYFAVGASGMTG